MNWLARLKKKESVHDSAPAKPTNPPFAGFVGVYPDPFQNSQFNPAALELHVDASNDGTAMDGVFAKRQALFMKQGLDIDHAKAVAERMTQRDAERDERRLCLECLHLSGGVGRRRCSQWQKIGMTSRATIPGELVTILQRCAGFTKRLEV